MHPAPAVLVNSVLVTLVVQMTYVVLVISSVLVTCIVQVNIQKINLLRLNSRVIHQCM